MCVCVCVCVCVCECVEQVLRHSLVLRLLLDVRGMKPSDVITSAR